ncbi:hypothetical protein C7C46_04810 [Streptomyces tateyamensis]|uniref:Uncharacterized protein n=1 Tax=Streptomyces tateyamensis TaxID=565073 RepID=A0A2V4P962_9ACTN|nr:hypothetical protein [Streptomyces tateyamensis]PYC87404.1 hypothetical protein C7C46_04810 [Streptomyces tateyamensis]
MKTLDAFRDLADALAAAEAGGGPDGDEQRAHRLAAVLADSPQLHRVDPGLLLAELMADPRNWPDQSWKNYFGNACVTVVRTETLRVDVLYWLQNSSTLHKHVSAGAFLALSGRRLHCEYDFAAADPLDSGVTFGALTATGRTMMRAASVSPILPTLVHELYWIEKPSVTVSIRAVPRSQSEGADRHRPHEFIAPGAGYLPAAFQRTSNLQRWIDGLGMLRLANRRLYLDTLERALPLVDPIHLIHVLDELCDNPLDEVSALLQRADAARSDDALARLAPAVPQFRRRKIFSRVQISGADGYLLAALLWSGAEGEELATLLKAEGVDEPGEFVRSRGERLIAVDPRTGPYVEQAGRSLR